MDLSSEITTVKIEATDSVSVRKLENPNEMRIDSNKDEFDCLVPSETCIKTEAQEDESDTQEFVGTRHEIYPNYDTPIETDEPMGKIKPEDLFNKPLQHFLDIGNQDPAAVKNIEHLPSVSDKDTKCTREEAGEEEDQLIAEGDPESSGSELADEDQIQPEDKQSPNKDNICHLCLKIFTTKSHLNTHLRIHTGEKPFVCHICQKTFTQKCNLNSHMLIHEDAKPFECDVCKKVFRKNSNLNNHKLIHTDVRPFSCTECNKSFRMKHSLVLHKMVHTGEKPYVCNFCEKGFISQCQLRYHERVHTGEKPYSCDTCNKTFRFKDSLDTHMRRHTGVKPFSCDICKKSFHDKSNLNRHKKGMHMLPSCSS